MATRTYTTGRNMDVRRLDNLTGSWVDVSISLLDGTGAPITGDLYDVMTDPNDPDKVFVVGDRNATNAIPGIYYSSDAGVTWNKAGGDVATDLTNGGTKILEVWVVDSNTIYATSDWGFLFKSTDGGLTFNHTTANPDVPGFPAPQNETRSGAVHFPDANNGVVAFGQQGAEYIGVTTDGGASWAKTNLALVDGFIQLITGVHISSSLLIINALSKDGIYRSTDGGTTFVKIYNVPGSELIKGGGLLHLTWTDDNNLWVYGRGGLRLRSTDAGATWSIINPWVVTGPTQFAGHHYYSPNGFFSNDNDILVTNDDSVTGTVSNSIGDFITAVWTQEESLDPNTYCYLATNCDDPNEQILITIDPAGEPLDVNLTYVFDIDPDKCWIIEESDACDQQETISLNTGVTCAGTLGNYNDQDCNWNVTEIPPTPTPLAIPFPARVSNQLWFSGYGSLPGARWITVGQTNNSGATPHDTTTGISVYELEFTPPPSFVPVLNLQFLSDNTITSIQLNGNSVPYVPVGTPWTTPTPVNVTDPSFFNVGTNVLRIEVSNTGVGSYGFAMSGDISNANPPATPVVVLDQFDDCEVCNGVFYELTDCEGNLDPIQTADDLSAFVDQVVTLVSCPDVCWQVALLADPPQSTESVNITNSFVDCATCLPAPEPEPPLVIRNRKVKPGYDTPGCPPEYVEKIMCKFSESLFQQMASVRYGIEFCCNDDAQKWELKKELLDLKMITDPEACENIVIECCPPCDLRLALNDFRTTSCQAADNLLLNLQIT